MYAGGISKRSSRSLWSRKSPFRCPLCHQAIPFEIRRRRELCYLRVWADQRQIPGWDAYVRNWYAWWGFPSRIVNYHNLVAGRGQSLAMPIPYRHACCIRFAQGEGGRYQFDFATRKETTAVCLRVRCVARTPSWPPLLDSKCIPPPQSLLVFPFQLAATRYIGALLILLRDCTTHGEGREKEEREVTVAIECVDPDFPLSPRMLLIRL